MRQRRIIALIILTTVMAVASALRVLRCPEPQSGGKPISVWLEELPSGKSDCLAAIHEIGTNGLKYAVRNLARNDSLWRRKYSGFRQGLPTPLRNVLPGPGPALRVVDGANWFRLVGSNSIPCAISLLKHDSPTVRQASAWGLGSLGRQTVAADQAVPALIGALGDSCRDVRFQAVLAFRAIGPAASNAVPAIRNELRGGRLGSVNDIFLRAAAARALGDIGPLAASALPDLKVVLQEQNSYLRGQAAVAIWRIDADVQAALPVLLQEMARTSELHKEDWITAIGEVGIRAREAIPFLEEELARGKEAMFVEEVTNALNKIISEAARAEH